MTGPAPTPEQYLQVLVELEASATPSEQAYYQKLRAKYEGMTRRAEQDPGGEEPEALSRNLDAGYEGLYALHYELSKPDLDHHWKTWLEGQVARYERGIGGLLDQLKGLGVRYTPPPNAVERLMAEEAEEARQGRIREVEILRGLKAAWAERNGRWEEVRAELHDLDEELRQLKQA